MFRMGNVRPDNILFHPAMVCRYGTVLHPLPPLPIGRWHSRIQHFRQEEYAGDTYPDRTRTGVLLARRTESLAVFPLRGSLCRRRDCLPAIRHSARSVATPQTNRRYRDGKESLDARTPAKFLRGIYPDVRQGRPQRFADLSPDLCNSEKKRKDKVRSIRDEVQNTKHKIRNVKYKV